MTEKPRVLEPPEWTGSRFSCGCPMSPENIYRIPKTGRFQCRFHKKLRNKAYATSNAEKLSEYHREYQKARRADLNGYMRDYRSRR